MAATYVAVGSDGLYQETVAINTSAGSGDAHKIVETGDDGVIHPSLLGNAVQPQIVANAAEALAAGDWVYINSSGTVAKAIATGATTLATGFVLAAVSSGAPATVYFEGVNTALSGLTRNVRHFLSATTAGATTPTPPASGSGHVVQCVGTTSQTSAIPFKPEFIVKRT